MNACFPAYKTNNMEYLTRRAMLQYGAAAIAMPLIGCEKKQDDIYPSSLYFYNSSSYLTAPRLEQIIVETKKAFDNVGISFKRAEEIKTFPELSGLDILMIYSESQIVLSYLGSYGQFTLNEADYLVMKQSIPSLPYSNDEAKVHLGYIWTPGLIKETRTEKDIMPLFIATSIHEIAHGLGAPHTEPAEGCTDEVCKPKQFYMVGRTDYMESVFHPVTVEKMKAFIQKVQAIPKHKNKEEKGKLIDSLRDISLSNFTYYAPFPEW